MKSISLMGLFLFVTFICNLKEKTFFFSERHSYVDSSETMSPASLKGRNNDQIGSSSMLDTYNTPHNIGSHYCNLCSARFVHENDLKAHFSQEHGDQMRYTCSICGKGYNTPSGFKYHMETHEGKTFACPICNYKLSKMSNVRRHMKRKHQASM